MSYFDLLPCPFCGSAPELIPFKRENDTWLVRCTGPDCQCKTVNYYGKAQPVFVWNKRIVPHVQRQASTVTSQHHQSTHDQPEK